MYLTATTKEGNPLLKCLVYFQCENEYTLINVSVQHNNYEVKLFTVAMNHDDLFFFICLKYKKKEFLQTTFIYRDKGKT